MEPIKKTRLYEMIVEEIQRYIRDNNLMLGDRLLPERDFAERLAVSRTSVRQALTVMNHLGLVEVRPGEGVFVGHARGNGGLAIGDSEPTSEGGFSIFSRGITLDLLEARRVLECGIAPLIVERVTDDDIAELQALVTNYEDCLEQHGLVTFRDDIEFHTRVIGLCQNDYLINVYDQIIRNWLRCPKDTTITNPPGPGSLTFHWSIIEALEARDVDALRNTMELHIEHVKQKIVSEISQRTGS